jgi:hypothetical protein
MRTKKRPPVATPDLTKAWSAFFADVAVEDPAELKREGWMTNNEIAELSKLKFGAGRQLADSAVREGKLEMRVAKVMVQGKRRNMNFYRPK